jgi:WhiB family redox-sensing transcriptional regulator
MPFFEHAGCRAPGVEQSWFFPGQGEPVDRAREVCAGCPHLIDCREYGLTLPKAATGIFGGLSRRERLEVLARHQHVVLEPVLASWDDGPIDDEPDEPEVITSAVARPCQGCGASLVGRANATKWCSDKCRNKSRAARARTNGHHVGSGLSGWEPLAALVAGGARLRSVELELAGQTWTLTPRGDS